MPEIRWFAPARENKARKADGYFLHETPHAVWLRAAIPEDRITAVTRHECKHRWDFLNGRPPSEESAEAFEERPRPFEQPRIIITPRPVSAVHVGANFS